METPSISLLSRFDRLVLSAHDFQEKLSVVLCRWDLKPSYQGNHRHQTIHVFTFGCLFMAISSVTLLENNAHPTIHLSASQLLSFSIILKFGLGFRSLPLSVPRLIFFWIKPEVVKYWKLLKPEGYHVFTDNRSSACGGLMFLAATTYWKVQK